MPVADFKFQIRALKFQFITLAAKLPTVFLGGSVTGSGLQFVISSAKTPSGVDHGQVIMELAGAFSELGLVLSCEQFLERKLVTSSDWQDGAMDMRIHLIEVYVETDDVFLAPLAACECVDVACPLLDLRGTLYMGIIRAMCQIDLLVTEGNLVHPLPGSAEDDVDHGAAVGLLSLAFHLLIGVGDAALRKGCLDAFRNGDGGVYGTHDTSLGHLEVESGTCRVIVAVLGGILPSALGPAALVLVRLVSGHPCGGLDVDDLSVVSCHI